MFSQILKRGFREPPITRAAYLEDTDEGLGEVVKVASSYFSVFKVISASKELHAQQGKDDDEEKEHQQERSDGADGVEQRGHQVAQRCPVPEGEEQQSRGVGRAFSPVPRRPGGSGSRRGIAENGSLCLNLGLHHARPLQDDYLSSHLTLLSSLEGELLSSLLTCGKSKRPVFMPKLGKCLRRQ